MPIHALNLDISPRVILANHTRIGGENRLGECYGVTSSYLTRNGKPFFGISGEFQFSRFPEAHWEEELLKMKASGINLIATYLFWIYHEPQPGVFDWTENDNVRRFVQLCGRHHLPVIARIGPFAHGECRNGGLPDWLYGMPFAVRSNDPGYLDCVRRYYGQVALQLSGLLFKDGGPVVAIQLDNEYEHSGAPWDTADRSAPVEWLPRGSDGVEHMRHLKRIAEEVGLVTPLYTVTAWGSPVIEDETLPVHGGYAYPVWIDNPGPSDLYLFYDRQAIPYPDARYRCPYYYPLINAEMQGGIQVRYNNRPVVPPLSTEALTLVQVGSGCNYIGYYMFHGGSHPRTNGVFTNEILHPQVSYDFQAPIGEYGEVRDAARFVKTLHLFLQAFGETLAPMQPVFPVDAITPVDTTTLRYAARVKDGSGFLFLNNYQDHLETRPIQDVCFELQIGGEKINLPREERLILEPEVCCLLPLNLNMHGARLVYATAQPLTVLENSAETHYFFFAPQGLPPEYCFAADTLSNVTHDAITGDTGKMFHAGRRVYLNPPAGWKNSFAFTTCTRRHVRVTTLTRAEAEHGWVGNAWGCQRLVLSSADPIFVNGEVEFRSTGKAEFEVTVFPALGQTLEARGGILKQASTSPLASVLHILAPEKMLDVQVEPCSEANKLNLRFHASLMDGVNDIFLSIDYTGDIGGAYIQGQLVADNYNNGMPWIIGLKRFMPEIVEHGLVLRFRPIRKGQVKNISNTMAGRMEFEGEEKLEIHKIEISPVYAVKVSVQDS